MSARPLRVAAYGYFGMGNLGNEGSLASFLAYMRTTHPEADLHCFGASAEAVRRDHSIPATQLMMLRTGLRHGLLLKAAKAVSRVWDVPRTFALMKDVDVLVVPGTGVLESQLMAKPWGLPYWMFLAVLSCRVRRRKVALVSVGAERPYHPVTRWLYRATVRLAHYCTYRDEESRDAVRAMGVRGRLGRSYPDLAFALRTPDERPERAGHVVIGVMVYYGAPDDPDRGPAVLRTYVDHTVDLVTMLVDDGRTVSLVVGDVADTGVAEEIVALARKARPGLGPDQVVVSPAGSLEEIMAEMATAEVVVASRFHNLICALKVARPTISLGYAEKNEHLMREFGLAGFVQGIDTFDVDRLAAQIAEAPQAHPSVEAQMKETLRRYEDDLADQFRRLSAELL